MDFIPGQRWICNTEPELGLATVLRVDARSVQMLFTASGVLRSYARDNAPFARAEFRVGQRISGKGRSLTIERVELHEGLLVYSGDGLQMQEGELDDSQPVSQADERLLAGRVDAPQHYALRLEALQRRAQARASIAWGLFSARVDLLPHQLRVAESADARSAPRLLLADETGLGKTIEAGMIIARLLATGRAARVLVLLPETLLTQWFVELLRRYNLHFALYDEARCAAIVAADPARNPFEDEQHVLAPLDWLLRTPARQQALLAAGWDLLVVDEAHHLDWSPQAPDPGYRLVEQLAARTPMLLLLTATPEQLGRAAHYARLRLLDPVRYPSLEAWQAESADYPARSALAMALESDLPLDAAARAQLAAVLHDEPGAGDWLARLPDPAAAQALLDALLDRHGIGRVLVRNRRASVGALGQRQPQRVTGAAPDATSALRLLDEFNADVADGPAPDYDYRDDPRLGWLLDLLAAHPCAKFLLLCRSEAKVLALEAALRLRSGVGVARFVESMGLLQRDRAAAWFAADDGARLLLCSEIGSEGRNFQFAQHLLLWDLPLDPDLLEQRIGRLDRIGQHGTIHIHHWAAAGSAQQALARWLDEGVEAFARTPADASALLQEFGAEVIARAIAWARQETGAAAALDALIAATRARHEQLSAAIEQGRDRLLELAAQRAAPQQQLLQALRAADAEAQDGHADFVLRLLESFGVHGETHDDGSLLLDPEYLTTEALGELKQGPLRATLRRDLALRREELALLGMDHPLLQGATDLLLESERGNAAFVLDDALPARSVVLEAVYVLECVAAPELDAPRWLPPTPLQVAVDNRLAERSEFQPSAAALRRAREKPVDPSRLRKLLGRLVPPMQARALELAEARAAALVQAAGARMHAALTQEIERLQALARVDAGVAGAEINALTRRRSALETVLAGARLRLDALRFCASLDVLTLK